FFFQAEDGIRDFHVTGVQTCALPILPKSTNKPLLVFDILVAFSKRVGSLNLDGSWSAPSKSQYPTFEYVVPEASEAFPVSSIHRSEERRVGKECRYRRSRYE